MELYLKIIRVYFKIMSKLNPGLAAKQAFTLFQKPRNIPFKNREKSFTILPELLRLPANWEILFVMKMEIRQEKWCF